MGVACGDYDNDGNPDIFVTAYGRPTLYRNNGNGTFTDVTEKAGIAAPGMDDQRRLVRLQQRRPARSLPLQLRSTTAATDRFACGDNKLGRQILLHSRAYSSPRRAFSTTTTATARLSTSATGPISRSRSARLSASSQPTSTTTA